MMRQRNIEFRISAQLLLGGTARFIELCIVQIASYIQ